MGKVFRFRRLKRGEPKRLGTGRWPDERQEARRWRDTLWVPVLVFLVTLAAGVALLRTEWPALALELPPVAAREAAAPAVARHFVPCYRSSDQRSCVVDGDTFRLRGETIRIADIDTPEVFSPQCPSEKRRGERATTRLAQLLSAGPFGLERIARDTDVYGRRLRVVVRDGRSLGGMLVAEGLARQWDGARRGWC